MVPDKDIAQAGNILPPRDHSPCDPVRAVSGNDEIIQMVSGA